MGEQTIDELREIAEALSGALQIAVKESDLLRRQVDAMAKVFSKHGVCSDCVARVMCRTSGGGGITCVEAIKQWSLEQAKGGG
jgi:hypothetical protein